MAAPLIAEIGIPVAVSILSDILGGMDNAAAKSAAKALKSGAITPEQLAEANRHAERMARQWPNPISLRERKPDTVDVVEVFNNLHYVYAWL